MVSTNKSRDNFNIYYIHSDGRFAVFQYDRQHFNNLHIIDKDKNWKNTPVNFIYYDGNQTLFSSSAGSPADNYVETHLDKPLPIGDSIHVKACIWPYLELLSRTGEWAHQPSGVYTLLMNPISTAISLDANGRLLSVSMLPSSDMRTKVAHSWEFSDYSDNRDRPYPATLTQRFLLRDKNEKRILDETSVYSLEFIENPSDFDQQIIFDNSKLNMDRYDMNSKNVYDPSGKLLYNADDLKSEYYEAVGLKNPIKTRNILFAIVGALGVGSVIAWRRKSA